MGKVRQAAYWRSWAFLSYLWLKLLCLPGIAWPFHLLASAQALRRLPLKVSRLT